MTDQDKSSSSGTKTDMPSMPETTTKTTKAAAKTALSTEDSAITNEERITLQSTKKETITAPAVEQEREVQQTQDAVVEEEKPAEAAAETNVQEGKDTFEPAITMTAIDVPAAAAATTTDGDPPARHSSDSSSVSSASSSVFGNSNSNNNNLTTSASPSSPPFSSASTYNDDENSRNSNGATTTAAIADNSSQSSSTITNGTSSINGNNSNIKTSAIVLTSSSAASSSSMNHSWMDNKSNKKAKRFDKGVCGLTNLGNTCFMNSALQCLSNTPQLSKYFLSGKHKEELNRDNPLGMKGEVAEAYGEVIEELWSGTERSIAPRHFKLTISRFNPTFVGYMQHDSQELLAFLLDGLHEDLNRILKKPYIELPDYDDMSDKEIAERSWSYHKARNDSVIVDLFQGQFKSRLECNECHKVSVTFDPFMYLSLPVPGQKQTKTKVVYVPYDPIQRPQQIIITTKTGAKITDLCEQVAKYNDVQDPSTLLVLEIFNDRVYKVFDKDDSVGEIGDSDIIYVYQLPGPVPKVPHNSNSSSSNSNYGYGEFGGNRRSNRRMNGGYGYTLARGRIMSSSDEEEEQEKDGKKKRKEASANNEWIAFPVYCETAPAKENGRVHPFGGPMILSIRAEDATSVDNIYSLIAQHLERYTPIKLFEEVVEDQGTEMTEAKEEEEEEEEGKEEQENGSFAEQQQPQQPIHTTAAVTAAGGRRMAPMNNLFTMKVINEERSYRSSALFPTGMNVGMSNAYGSKFRNLEERAQEEQKRREEYERQQEQNKREKEEKEKQAKEEEEKGCSSDKDEDVAEGVEKENKKEDDKVNDDDDSSAGTTDNEQPSSSIATPTKSASEKKQEADDVYDEDDVVEDAASTYNNSNSIIIRPRSPIKPKNTYNTNGYRLGSASSKSPAFGQSSSSSSSSSLTPPPPKQVIRQGEGIILEWKPKKAEQIFGLATSSNSHHYGDNEPKIDGSKWSDYEVRGDPLAPKEKKKKQLTLSDCLDEFTREELLSEEDLWYCPRCKKRQRASKKFDLWRMPEIVVVHLKRFSHTKTWRDKIDTFIDFPLEGLDLTERVLSIENAQDVPEEDRLIYDLYGVDNHFGGMGGGHYTAYAQNWEDKKWYNYDDSHVSATDANSVKTTAAYLLFYKRRRQSSPSPPPSTEQEKSHIEQEEDVGEDDKVMVEQQQQQQQPDNTEEDTIDEAPTPAITASVTGATAIPTTTTNTAE